MNTGTGWQVPRYCDRHQTTTGQSGCRGMDDMHSPRAATSHVNALCGTPKNEDVSCDPLGYMPTGRVPVLTQKVSD